jgi:hypothetical protein
MLFRSLFEAVISRGHDSSNESEPRLSVERVDLLLAKLLHYWLPIGSRNDGCLNAAVKANLLECSVLLLVARNHGGRALEMLFNSLDNSFENKELSG